MRQNTFKLISAGTNNGSDDVESDVIDARNIYAISIVANFTDVAAAGTLKIQGSNDVDKKGINVSENFTPTNWADVPNATATISAGEDDTILVNPICYRFLRVVWDPSAGTGTFDINVNTQGF